MNGQGLLPAIRVVGWLIVSSCFVLAPAQEQAAASRSFPTAPDVLQGVPGVDAFINLGDKVEGTLAGDGDVQTMAFDAPAGTKVSFRAKRQKGDMRIAMRLLGPGGVELVDPYDSSVTDNVARINKLLLEQTGTYFIEIMDLKQNGGKYSMRSTPNYTERFTSIVAVDGETAPTPFKVEAVAGTRIKSMLVKSIKPKGFFSEVSGQPANLKPQLALIQPPLGEALDVDSQVKVSKFGKKVTLKKVDLPLTGTYTVVVDGVDQTVGYAKVLTKLRYPKGGTKHVID